jgi:ComF family protein
MLRAVTDDLLAMLLPARCPGCGRRAEPVCARCAASMRAAPPGRELPGVAWSVAVFAYEGVARELIARVKYRNERVAVRWLATRLARACATAPVSFDVITWAPASERRRIARGVDHGALLARAVAAELGCGAETLLRRDAGPPQTGRAYQERRAGPALRSAGAIGGRSVLVVDDVTTTGATLAAAAAALRAGGAREVLAATIARTPRPSGRPRGAAYTPEHSIAVRHQ